MILYMSIENNLNENNLNENNLNSNQIVIDFLNTCNISCDNLDMLSGIIIPREQLLNKDLYDKVKVDIPKLKKILPSSIFTSVQKNAQDIQRWPLLNLVRQILRRYKYDLVPKRICDGYTKDGKKKYKRLFEIKKIIN